MFEYIGLVTDSRFWFLVSLFLILAYHFTPEKKKKILFRSTFMTVAAFGISYWFSDFLKEIIRIPRPCTGLPVCPPDFGLPVSLTTLIYTILMALLGITNNCCPSDFGFPSSHATVAFAICGVLAGITNNWIFILAFIVALSRVYLGVHTIGQIFAGSILGLGIAYGVKYIFHDEKKQMKVKSNDKKSKGRNKGTRSR